jgi:hypothetical protein
MPHVPVAKIFERDNIELAPGAMRPIASALLALGLVCLALTAIAGVITGNPDDPASVKAAADGASTALHAFHTGALVVLGFSLGALVFYMIACATRAGWWALLRRPFEHAMSLVWVGIAMVIAVLLLQALFVNVHGVQTYKGDGLYAPFVWNWMDPYYTGAAIADNPALEQAGYTLDPLYDHKRGYLNLPFFLVRMVAYIAVWVALCKALTGLSRTQDQDGNKWHANTMTKVSAIGLPFFGIATAFASFDWMMSLDYHWFSTMFGVYFFAGSVLSAVCLTTLALIALRSFGKVRGAFTVEHQHDMAKLVFAFTVFWAYITFSQYFLIWYGAIPEESMWFTARKDKWNWLSYAIPIGHFAIPFLLLLPRPVRRNALALSFACVWLIGFHILDVFWVVRPEVKGMSTIAWQDIVGIGAPVLIFLGLYLRRFENQPLIPLKDPRTAEALEHKNFV